MKKKYAMLIDTVKCIGCGDCVMACKTENTVPEGLHRLWVVQETSGRFPDLYHENRSERCNHCSTPACVYACPTGASYVQKGSNITLVEPGKCVGCKSCVAACPYDARFIMPEGYIGKCTFCEQRLAAGLEPACASVCPTHCIFFGDLNDPASDVARLLRSRKYKTIIPEAGTRPNNYFLI